MLGEYSTVAELVQDWVTIANENGIGAMFSFMFAVSLVGLLLRKMRLR